MPEIAVIDYDMGNLHSACKGLEKAGATPIITDSPQVIARADGVVLPGVGAFDPAMKQIRARGLENPIKQAIDSGKPFLAICVGLQVLFDSSEEGQEAGLGIVPGVVKRFQPEPGITIPHMGWNQLELKAPQSSLWQGLTQGSYVYFVHSYYAQPSNPSWISAAVTHGSQTVTAAIALDNLAAVQFHPEKSSLNGLRLLSNFVATITETVLA